MKLTKERAEDFFAELYKGHHHIPSPGVRQFEKDRLWWYVIDHASRYSTYDGDLLTRLVFLCHDKHVRAELRDGGFGRIKIIITPRDREGYIFERHPTIGEALENWRENGHKEE